jgi:beta-xylosidase
VITPFQVQQRKNFLLFKSVPKSGRSAASHPGREVFLAKVDWTKDGWPIIGNGGRVETVMDAPRLPAVFWPEKPVRDDFDGVRSGWTGRS